MRNAILTAFVVVVAAAGASARSLAVIANDKSKISDAFTAAISIELGKKYRIVDTEIANAAFWSFKFPVAANLSLEESRAAGSAIGCDDLILIDAATVRRSSSKRPEYYESYAAVYVVSSRSGGLILWSMPSFDADSPEAAESRLLAAAVATGRSVIDVIERSAAAELSSTPPPNIELLPDDPAYPAGFQAPAPYRRIKPEYTADAYLHAIAATVEILVDIDTDGRITRTEINRWAGYGLDESVENAVRSMNWRPAYRGGKPMPMRVLLRYNFKRAEKQSSQ